MKSVLVQVKPDGLFWEEYADLWKRSAERSPFQSPEILRYFSDIDPGSTLALQFRNGSRLMAAVLLRKERSRYTFLSDLKTDVNHFVIDSEATVDDMNMFFSTLIELVRGSGCSMVLNYVPDHASYLSILSECGKRSGLYWELINYSVCPVVEGSTAEELYVKLRESRQMRYKYNRLRKHHNATFEVLEDGSDMALWTEEFCATHVLRWAGTPTPSVYGSKERQKFLLGCLEAWQREGILVRFAIRVDNRRVGFVIGLIDDQSLIFHSTTYDPEFQKCSPGKAILVVLSEWMRANNKRILDFGDGDEKYKYDFANTERRSCRIFISERSAMGFVLKTKMIKFVRENPYLYKLYRDNLKIFQKKLAS